MGADTLTADVLLRLTRDALPLFYGSAAGFEARAIPGFSMALSGEPVADLNYLLLTDVSTAARDGFRAAVEHCDSRELPFAAIVAPRVAEALDDLRDELQLLFATDWPLMVCPWQSVSSHPAADVGVRPVVEAPDHAGLCQVLAGAFKMPAESVARAVPLKLFDSPAIDAWIAERDGAIQSTVTVTHHGPVLGVWAMGTAPEAQGQGVGKVLLSEMMGYYRDQGIEEFFLGATPSGFPLYERLGYRTVCRAPIWVRGVTHQA